jgi:hypothetical protein
VILSALRFSVRGFRRRFLFFTGIQPYIMSDAEATLADTWRFQNIIKPKSPITNFDDSLPLCLLADNLMRFPGAGRGAKFG